MAAPTLPSLISLSTEGLKKAGYSSPSAAKLTRAQDEWMEEVKNDIFTILKDGIMLQTTGYVILSEGQQKYAFPTDFARIQTAKLLFGTQTGTAQAGAADTITLAAASTFTEDWTKGKEILITSGTGAPQISMCSAYDASTKIATCAAWNTTPDNTSVYMIIDTEYKLDIGPVWDFDKEQFPMNKNRPNIIYPIGDPDNGEFLTLENPDRTYGIRVRYFQDLSEVDLTSPLMDTLYKRWRNIWIQGVKAKALEDDDDDRAPDQLLQYGALINGLIARERFGVELSELQVTVDMG